MTGIRTKVSDMGQVREKAIEQELFTAEREILYTMGNGVFCSLIMKEEE